MEEYIGEPWLICCVTEHQLQCLTKTVISSLLMGWQLGLAAVGQFRLGLLLQLKSVRGLTGVGWLHSHV